jgi:hypothetical protein
MRSLQLQTALTEFIEAAAEHLHADVLAGAEVAFELEPRSGRRGATGPALYCYRALTGQFVSAREPELARLPGYGEAVLLLERFDGLERYLGSVSVELPRGGVRPRAQAAIRALLTDVFDEQSDFELRPERLQAALERLERSASASPGELALVASLHGLVISSAELPVAKGLTIAQPHALEGLPAAVTLAGGEQASDHLVVVLTAEVEDSREALSRGCEVLRELLRALRLFGDGRVALGAIAWTRVGAGAWSPVALGGSVRPRGMLVVSAEQEDELRAFCSLVSRRAPHGNELAWALRRFELGCERENPYEALTDHLLALRMLLEPEGPASGMLARRLAALCATPTQQPELAARTMQALALEHAIVAGTAVEHTGGRALANDVADHLRALLRDVICGHLAADLVAVADAILQAASEPAGEATAGEPLAMATSSGEQLLGDPNQSLEILDVFI